MIPGHRAPLDKPGPGLACKTVAHEHQDLKGNTPVHRQPVQFRTDELRYMPKPRNSTNQSSSSIQNRLQLINMRQRYTSVNCTTIISEVLEIQMEDPTLEKYWKLARGETGTKESGKEHILLVIKKGMLYRKFKEV